MLNVICTCFVLLSTDNDDDETMAMISKLTRMIVVYINIVAFSRDFDPASIQKRLCNRHLEMSRSRRFGLEAVS